MSNSTSVGGSEHVHELLSELLNGDLAETERQRVEEHLATCSECQDDWQSLRRTVELVRRLPSHPVPRSFALPVARTPRRQPIVWLRISTSALAATFLALLAVRLLLASTFLQAPSASAPMNPAAPPAST